MTRKENILHFFRNTWKHRTHLLMALPTLLIMFFFLYVPMGGLIIAFKNFKPVRGIWGSAWAQGKWGIFENFRFLLVNKDRFIRLTGNTLMYFLIFTVIGTLLNVILAVCIDQMVFKKLGSAIQSIVIIPIFISYAAVTFIVEAYLKADTGMINNVFGLTRNWYAQESQYYWILILTIVKMWNSVGYGSVLYMSVLAGVDQQLYEAAQIDGANKWQQIWHITLPSLIPMVSVMLLLSVGNIMKSDTGLFYQVTRYTNTDTTGVLDSYVLYAIQHTSDFSFPSAASFFQSVVGLALILIANAVVKKIQPEYALI